MCVLSRIGKTYVVMSTLLSATVIVLIISVTFMSSWPAMQEIGWRGLFSLVWNPSNGSFGIVSMLYGSLAVTSIALLCAVPVGLLCAIYTAEILPGKYRLFVKSLLEILSGIPSIIYGLIGIAFLSLWIGDIFALATGRTILTASLLLAVMILPTIITLSDDAIHNVPDRYREAASGLGLYPYEVIKEIILPIAKADIIGVILLALGRALGETMAVMLVIGSIDRVPDRLYNFLLPGQTVTSKLGREIAETAFGSTHFSAMVFMGLILLLTVLILTLTAQYLFRREARLYE